MNRTVVCLLEFTLCRKSKLRVMPVSTFYTLQVRSLKVAYTEAKAIALAEAVFVRENERERERDKD